MGPFAFKSDDAPRYQEGFIVVVVTAIAAGILVLVYRGLCMWMNRKRDRTGVMEGFEHAYEDDLTDVKVRTTVRYCRVFELTRVRRTPSSATSCDGGAHAVCCAARVSFQASCAGIGLGEVLDVMCSIFSRPSEPAGSMVCHLRSVPPHVPDAASMAGYVTSYGAADVGGGNVCSGRSDVGVHARRRGVSVSVSVDWWTDGEVAVL